MSLFAGIYSLKQGQDGVPPKENACRSLVRSISRTGDRVEEYCGKRFFLAKVDIGAFAERAFWRSDHGMLAALAGHPYLARSEQAGQSRTQQLKEICGAASEEDGSVFRQCNGSFAFCSYDERRGRLTLATDRLGVRPLYYHIDNNYLYFATSLRVLESLSAVRKEMDIEAVAQMTAFGYALGNRTPFRHVKILEDGQLLRAAEHGVHVSEYSRLDSVPEFRGSENDLHKLLYETFKQAVNIRNGQRDVAFSLLSGGLDSRCIVTALRELGKQVCTLTFKPPILDAEIAKAYADALGNLHQEQPLQPGEGEMELALKIKDVEWPAASVSGPPQLIFSGDGGSVGVGFVYLEEELVQLARRGRTRPVAERLAGSKLPKRFFKHGLAEELQAVLVNSVELEVARNCCEDHGRNLHLFFMRNDQRRHLHALFENIDEYRIEFLTPFFHGELLDLLVSGPTDRFLRHAFYHRWLEQFPKVVFSVPWQTYPGHLPCPVPNQFNERKQWDKTRRERFAAKRGVFRRCFRHVLGSGFPASIINRPMVFAALLAHGIRLRDFSYVFSACNEFARISRQCGGQVHWPRYSKSALDDRKYSCNT